MSPPETPAALPHSSKTEVPAELRPSELQLRVEADKAAQKNKKLPKIPSRREAIANRRQTFASGLFNNDLKELAEWHRYRSPAEQKRFLKSVDTVYSAWCKKGEQELSGMELLQVEIKLNFEIPH